MHSQEPLGSTRVIKMNIRKQLDEFKQIVKAPPIENPRKENDWDTSNDDLDMAGFKKLFEDVAYL